MNRFGAICGLVILLLACGKMQNFMPKPKGFAKIDLPEQTYKKLDGQHPYQFEMSAAATEEPDRDKLAKPHWIILRYPTLNAMIQLTYYPVHNDLKRLQQIVNDSYKLTARHQVRATSITEENYQSPRGTKAVFLNIEGEVPTELNFFTTDTSQHFLRGAVYFKVAGKSDSLKPIMDFLRKDVVHLINTLEYRK